MLYTRLFSPRVVFSLLHLWIVLFNHTLFCLRKFPTILPEINGEHEHLLEQDFTGERFCLILNSGTDKVMFEERLMKTLLFVLNSPTENKGESNTGAKYFPVHIVLTREHKTKKVKQNDQSKSWWPYFLTPTRTEDYRAAMIYDSLSFIISRLISLPIHVFFNPRNNNLCIY